MQKPLVEDEMDPRLPSINDPFNLFGCSELPFPLTPSEDIILKHILGICSSDYQMSKRAYDSIICMWAKKNQAGGGTAPFLTQISPDTIPTASTSSGGTEITFTGGGFVNGSRIFVGGQDEGEATYISPTQVKMRIYYTEPIGIAVAVVNPGDLISNDLTLTVNPHPNTPRISSVTPNQLPSGQANTVISISGTNFIAGCQVTKSTNDPGLWDGTPIPTTFISSTRVDATLDLTSVAPNKIVVIRVRNVTGGQTLKSYPIYIPVVLGSGEE